MCVSHGAYYLEYAFFCWAAVADDLLSVVKWGLNCLQEVFVTRSEGDVHVHVLPSDKYKMSSVWIQMERPVSRTEVTASVLLPHVLLRGTERYQNPEDLMQAFDGLYGASISARAGKRGDFQTIELTLQVPADRYVGRGVRLFASAMNLLGDVLAHPHLPDGAFPRAAVESEIELHRQRLDNLVNDKISYAMERCVEVLCEGEAYGVSRLGYAADLPDITPQSLVDTYRLWLAGSPLHVYIVSPDDPERVTQEAFAALRPLVGACKTGAAATAVMTVSPAQQGPSAPRVVVERMDVSQAKLNMGLRTGVGFGSDDYPALLVYNGLLGAFEHSRLFVHVRERASLAYYASSRLDTLKGLIFIAAGIQESDYDKTRAIIEEQLAALRRGEVSEDDLRYTKEGLTHHYLQSDDQPFTSAMMHMFARFCGRERSVESLMDAVMRVTVADVVRVASNVSLDAVYLLQNGGA